MAGHGSPIGSRASRMSDTSHTAPPPATVRRLAPLACALAWFLWPGHALADEVPTPLKVSGFGTLGVLS